MKKAKKPAKSTKRTKKGAIKDLEPKSSPKGGLNFASQSSLDVANKVSLNFNKYVPTWIK